MHAFWVELLFFADTPSWGSYDVLVLLCNVLHMAPGPGSKLGVEWCFCSTRIIQKERKTESVFVCMCVIASNKAVKMFTKALHQKTPQGSCCLPGANLQIIYCWWRCHSALTGLTVYFQFKVRALMLLPKEQHNKKLKMDYKTFGFSIWPICDYFEAACYRLTSLT